VRYLIYGAGAIGATIGAVLFEAKKDVVFIARGEHGRAIERNGLSFGAVLDERLTSSTKIGIQL